MTESPSPDAQTRLQSPTLLIVEPEETEADALALALIGMDFATMTAYDAHTALDLARLRPPDLLLTGARLNGTSGRQLATAILQFAPACKIILLVTPGENSPGQDSGTQAAHDFQVLHKPVDTEELHARLQVLLRS